MGRLTGVFTSIDEGAVVVGGGVGYIMGDADGTRVVPESLLLENTKTIAALVLNSMKTLTIPPTQ